MVFRLYVNTFSLVLHHLGWEVLDYYHLVELVVVEFLEFQPKLSPDVSWDLTIDSPYLGQPLYCFDYLMRHSP